MSAQDQIRELRGLLEAATKGPWEVIGSGIAGGYYGADIVFGIGDDGKSYGLHNAINTAENWDADARLIVALVNNADALIELAGLACEVHLRAIADGGPPEWLYVEGDDEAWAQRRDTALDKLIEPEDHQ